MTAATAQEVIVPDAAPPVSTVTNPRAEEALIAASKDLGKDLSYLWTTDFLMPDTRIVAHLGQSWDACVNEHPRRECDDLLDKWCDGYAIPTYLRLEWGQERTLRGMTMDGDSGLMPVIRDEGEGSVRAENPDQIFPDPQADDDEAGWQPTPQLSRWAARSGDTGEMTHIMDDPGDHGYDVGDGRDT